jgi:RNA recognition motif-containing protein
VNKKLYIGNLSSRTSKATLSELFTVIGKVVSVNLATDYVTGRCKGFAFVEMAKKRAARKAIKQLDGRIVDGQAIEVMEAHLRRTREQGIPFGMRRHRQPPWQR